MKFKSHPSRLPETLGGRNNPLSRDISEVSFGNVAEEEIKNCGSGIATCRSTKEKVSASFMRPLCLSQSVLMPRPAREGCLFKISSAEGTVETRKAGRAGTDPPRFFWRRARPDARTRNATRGRYEWRRDCVLQRMNFHCRVSPGGGKGGF